MFIIVGYLVPNANFLRSCNGLFMKERKPKSISWYRTVLEPHDFKSLHKKSDLLGGLQTAGYLSCFMLTVALSMYSLNHWHWVITVGCVFLHGMIASFMINAVHELTHGTVFQTKSLNVFFARVFAFIGWINHEHFVVSHARHHRYTLHQPDDLEVVLPLHVMVRHFFTRGFINPIEGWFGIKNIIRLARGKFEGEWEATLFPCDAPQKNAVPVRWARIVLVGHMIVVIGSLSFGQWLLPVLISFTPFYGGWLFFLCNNTQHIGLQDDVPDFRLSCRTFTLNPVVRFLYWHMNFHIEHHMFAAVPCYRLGQLHKLIRHDLPPCNHGLIATWREIAAIQAIQKINPSYQHVASLPVLGCNSVA